MEDRNKDINLHIEVLSGHEYALKCNHEDFGVCAIKIPRNELDIPFVEPETKYYGVYFLVGEDENGVRQYYVGQAGLRECGESVIQRCKEHAKSTSEWYQPFWRSIVFFSGLTGSWDRAVISDLEYYFYSQIPAKQRLNKRRPDRGSTRPFEYYRFKIEQIKIILTKLGFDLFKNELDENSDSFKKTSISEHIETLVRNTKNVHDGRYRIPSYTTPVLTAKQMVDLISADKWTSEAKFLCLECSDGTFPKLIYEKLFNLPDLIKKFPDERKRHTHIIENQIYGIALSPVTLSIVLTEYYDVKNNIKIIPGYIDKLKDKNIDMQEVINKEFGNMKFDAIITNPPYQNGTQSIYQYFIDAAIKLKPKQIIMIVRNNWLTSDTMKNTRSNLIKFGLKDIINYSSIGEIFPNVGVAVSIFNAQKDYEGDTHIVEIKKEEVINEVTTNLQGMPAIFMNRLDNSIVNKILSKKEDSFSEEVYPQEAFRITSIMGSGRGDNSCILNFETTRTDEYSVGVLCQENGIQYYNWIKLEDVPNRAELINQYKVVACARYNYNDNPITSITGLGPGTVCSSTFCPLYASYNKEQAYGAYTYIRTKFFRYLVRVLCTSGITNHSEARFALVPLQDFSKTWTDKELYEKYGLTQEEVNYIEASIKSLD